MSKHFKPLPADSDQYRSIQIFKNFCQSLFDEKTRSEGKSDNIKIQSSQFNVVNRDFKDGKFEIVYHHPEESFFCGAQVDLNNHEMVARVGISETRTIRTEAQMEMSDTCSVARHLVGDGEIAAQNCSDEAVSPEIFREGVLESSSMGAFQKYCTEKLQETAVIRKWGSPIIPFAMERVQVINPDNIDPLYNLRYASEGQDFVCDATVDAKVHQMWLRHSAYKNHPELLVSQPGTIIEMTDACTLTTRLIGEEKLNGECHDKTQAERTRDQWTNTAFNVLVSGLSLYSLYKIGKKLLPKLKTRFFPGLRMVGNALLAGWLFDKATGLFVSEETPLRKYGYYGALATGALAPALWTRLMTTQLGKGIGTRLMTSRLLGPTLSRLGGARLGARFLAVVALDLGIQWLFVDGDYDASLNKRVTDEIYDEHVYSSHWSDWFVLPLLLRGTRAAAREIAPSAVEWGVANDHDEIKERLKKEDRDNSEQGKELMKNILPQLLSNPSFYDPRDPQSYHRINLERLEEPIELTWREKVLSQHLEGMKPEAAMKAFQVSEKQYEEMFQRILLKNIQDTAAFLVFVKQQIFSFKRPPENPLSIEMVTEEINEWSRYVFNPNGTLKPGQATSLLYELFKDDPSGMSPAAQIYRARKIQVIAAYLNQDKTFGAYDIKEVALAAGILDEAGQLKIEGAFLTALSIYVSETLETKDSRRMNILENLYTHLKWRYLKAGPYTREAIGDALKVLGVKPEDVMKQEVTKCFWEKP